MCLLFFSNLILWSCGSEPILGATATLSPTVINTPQPMPSATLIITPTFTTIPTASAIPIPECKSEIYSSADLDEFGVGRTGGTVGERIIETDNGESVSKVVYTEGYVQLVNHQIIFSLPGTYLISLEVKRGDFTQFRLYVSRPTTDLQYVFTRDFYIRDISDLEYTKIWGTFIIEKYSTLRVAMGAEATTNNQVKRDGKPVIVWVKNLKICLVD